MNQQTFSLVFPAGVAEAFLKALCRILQQEGFQESLEAGEVGGIEVRIWQQGNATVTIRFHETDAEETIHITVPDNNGVEWLIAAVKEVVSQILNAVYRALPPSEHPRLQEAISELCR